VSCEQIEPCERCGVSLVVPNPHAGGMPVWMEIPCACEALDHHRAYSCLPRCEHTPERCRARRERSHPACPGPSYPAEARREWVDEWPSPRQEAR